jgi:hypothetical protein
MPDVVTVDQIRDLIKSENIRPSDIFPMEKLTADPAVRGFAEDRVRERIGSEFQHRKAAEEELEKLKKEAVDKESALTEKLKSLELNAAKAQIGPLLEKQKETRKLDERQLKFVQNRLTRFNPKNPADVEKEFTSYLDEQIDEYGKLAKDVFGIEEKKADDKGNAGVGPDKTKSAADASKSKYIDPKQNPMIKT